MSTLTFGTGAGDKWQDSGATLSGSVYRVNGASDMCLMDTTDLGVDGNTVAYWRPGSKQSWLDQTANDNDGTGSTDPTLGNYGATFNGTTDCVVIADSASLDGATTDYQFEAWVNAVTRGESSAGRILDRSSSRFVWYYYDPSDAISLYVGADRTSDVNSFDLGALHHWTSGHASGGTIDHYEDGVAVGTSGNANISTGAETLYIGNNGASGTRAWNGFLDEIKFSKVQRYTGAFTPYRFPASATVTVVADGGANSDWSNIAHTRTVAGDYEGSVSQLRYRAGADNPPTGSWTTVATPAVSEDIDVTGQYLQVEFTLAPKSDTSRTETPQLLTCTLTYAAAAGGYAPGAWERPWLETVGAAGAWR